MTMHLIAAAAEHNDAGGEFGPYIAAGIAAAVFIGAAVVLRSFREVRHRSAPGDAGALSGSDT